MRKRHAVSRKHLQGTWVHAASQDEKRRIDKASYKARRNKVVVAVANMSSDGGGDAELPPAPPPTEDEVLGGMPGLVDSSESEDYECRPPAGPWRARPKSTAAKPQAEQPQPSQCERHTTVANLKRFFNVQDVPTEEHASPTVSQGSSTRSWTNDLPRVGIKQEYEERKPPTVAEPGGRTGAWPCSMRNFQIAIPNFLNWLKDERSTKDSCVRDHARSIARVLHMLKVEGLDVQHAAEDVRLWVAMYMSNTHAAMFRLDLLQPTYTWTKKIMEAVRLFIEFLKQGTQKRSLLEDDPLLVKYSAALDQFSAFLKGGVSRKVQKAMRSRLTNRRQKDGDKISTLCAVPVMKEAVHRAMMMLDAIYKSYKGRDDMPDHVQREATRCLIGILVMNGFFGRKMEWEQAERDHIRQQIANGADYIICKEHKTACTYGRLAKWIAPGTIAAIEIYMSLPVPDAAGDLGKLLLVGSGDKPVNVSEYLRAFCRKMMAAEISAKRTVPTVNLMRKWFHTELYRLQANSERLMQFMVHVDAHSKHTAMKHYVLQTPKDDAMLARELVRAVIGDPVRGRPPDGGLRGSLYSEFDV